MPFYGELLHLRHCPLWEQFVTREEENMIVWRHLGYLFLKLPTVELKTQDTISLIISSGIEMMLQVLVLELKF